MSRELGGTARTRDKVSPSDGMPISHIAGWADADARSTPQYGYGVEVELEHAREMTTPRAILVDASWSATPDGSLRGNAVEWVLRGPMDIGRTQEALRVLYTPTLRGRASVRTSTHVHSNMLHSNMRELAAVLALYACTEPAIYIAAGEQRDQCIYCIPWYASREIAKRFGELYSRETSLGAWRRFFGNCNKYSGLNLATLVSIGTVELRMAPTFASLARASHWVGMVDRLVHTALEIGSADAVIERAMEDSAGLARAVIGEAMWDGEEMPDAIDSLDSVGTAQFLSCTYKPSVKKWVVPGFESGSERGRRAHWADEMPVAVAGDNARRFRVAGTNLREMDPIPPEEAPTAEEPFTEPLGHVDDEQRAEMARVRARFNRALDGEGRRRAGTARDLLDGYTTTYIHTNTTATD